MAGQIQTAPPGASPLLQFMATLSGSLEVPPRVTSGSGVALLGFDPTLTRLNVLLLVSRLRRVTAGHIHLGRPGQNGPIVLFLFRPAMPVDIVAPTVLTNASFPAANLIGPLAGMPLSALAQQMMAGNTYVNVHTVANPEGEIRGPIVT